MTQKKLSTISYNTKDFLKLKLDQLCDDGKIDYYFFVYHLKEEDEQKDHIHLFIQPNKPIDKAKLRKEFLEPDPVFGMLKPLGIVAWNNCNDLDEWILYDRHYPPYLKSKGQERKYEYEKEQFVSNDQISLDYWWEHSLNESNWAREYRLTKELRETKTPIDLINTGRIPLSQAGSLVAYERLKAHTWRAGKAATH